MFEVFSAFNVPVKEYKKLELKANPDQKLKRKKKINIPNIDVPDYFIPMTEFSEDNILANGARKFLWDNYKLTQDDYPFMLSSGKTKSTKKDDQYWSRYLQSRIIIPAYNRNTMIYWQARIFVGEEEDKKYISASVDDSAAGS